MGAVDLVITETVGTAYLVTEDFLDRFAVRAIENKWCNPIATVLARSIFNINRSFANLLRWKYPWYRVQSRRCPQLRQLSVHPS